MTLVSLPSPIAWPGMVSGGSGGPSFNNAVTVSSAGHYMCYVFSAREDMTISHVGFRCNAASGSPTIETRIETVDTATGLPSGALWATNTNGTTGTISTSSWTLQALTASASVTKGQVFCVKLAYASGTSLIIANSLGMASPHQSVMPYLVTNTGTPTRAGTAATISTLALGSSSTSFYQLQATMPINTITNNTFNNTSSAKRGMRFTPPMDCRIIGVRWYQGGATGDCNFAIYSDAGSELSSSSTVFEGDVFSNQSSGSTTVYFDNPVTVDAGTTYRVAFEPTSSTNVNITTYTLPSANYRGATPAGTTAHYTTYTASTWVDTATDQVPLIDILIDQLDDGTGSGSGGSGGQRVIG